MADKNLAIVLKRSGKSKEVKINKDLDVTDINKSIFPEKYIKSSRGDLERECDFDYIDKVISVFAFNKGSNGTENKTELPPPLDKQLYFGNIFIVAHKDDKVVNLDKSEFDIFYESAFGGFEDINSDDSWSEDDEQPNTDDEEFIVNDDEELSRESSSSEEEEFIGSDSETSDSEELDLSVDSHEEVKPKKKEKSNKKKKDSSKKVKSKKDKNKKSIEDEELELINKYVRNISKSFKDSPKDFKEMLYKHHDKNPKYILKWLVNQLNEYPDEYKEAYLAYREIFEKK